MPTSCDIVEKATIMNVYIAPYIAYHGRDSQTLSLSTPGKNVDFSAS
jgi:hypothetical protein